ncbi:MAG: tautomerase family protein [Alphaproteobacteria bacterium]|nr:tautomerase family protein [Alphaproteobacteria bacterium]
MPLVRIALRQGRPAGFGRRIGAVIHQAMVDTIGVPPRDVFQIVTEHDADGLIYDPSYLDISRSDGIVLVQITLSEGRTDAAKQALYKAIAERLRDQLAVRAEDVFINLIEVKKANWSFGNGIAQYIA